MEPGPGFKAEPYAGERQKEKDAEKEGQERDRLVSKVEKEEDE